MLSRIFSHTPILREIYFLTEGNFSHGSITHLIQDKMSVGLRLAPSAFVGVGIKSAVCR